ncbi:hypothetical protein B0H11DRAFT_1921569 [Mycena galericulata]|nr:hypothetical protein B0H11DRAFT_1921569 [Mycena galericulata]
MSHIFFSMAHLTPTPQSRSAGQLRGNILVNSSSKDRQPMLDDSYVGILWLIPPNAACPSRTDCVCWTTVTREYSGQFLHTQSVLRGRTAYAGRQLRGNILVNSSIRRVSFEDGQPMLDDSYAGIFWSIPPNAECPSRTDSVCWTTVTGEYSGQFLQMQSVLRGRTAYAGRQLRGNILVNSSIRRVSFEDGQRMLNDSYVGIFFSILHAQRVLRGWTAYAGRQLRGNILVNSSKCRVSFEDGQRMLDDSYGGIFWLIPPYAECPSRTDSESYQGEEMWNQLRMGG